MTSERLFPDCNCFALRQAARYVTQLYERHLAPLGVTSAQYTLLAKLARRPGLTMLELAHEMVMDRTSVVRALKPLQRDGYVIGEISKHHGRTHAFRLTRAGEQLLEQARLAWRSAQDEFEQRFGRDRAQALRDELHSLTAA